MKSMHPVTRSASVLILLFSLSISQFAFGATRRAAKAPKRPQAAKHPQNAKQKGRGKQAENRRLAARRRAEAARLAAIARQRAAEEALRDRVQAMIAKDDVSGEDPEVRRIALDALGHHAGTVVVMDPKTGRIYSVVNQQWALRQGFKPCSTIKLVTGLAGLNEQVIDPADTTAISDSNKVDLTRALAYSKNDYFQQVGGQVGFSKMISYAHQLGLGEKTGINSLNESQGQVPKLKSGFAVNHMSSHGDDFKVTAVQLATLVSAMVNGGQLITPFIPRTAREEARTAPKVRRMVKISDEAFRQMVPGMIGSVSYGSGRRAANSQEIVAGKTGTCIEQGEWIGLFASYAPLNNPRLAVVVIARGADGRNHFPAAVAGQIYRRLTDRFGGATTQQMASSETKTSSNEDAAAANNRVADDNGKTALSDDDEEEVEEAGEESSATTTPAQSKPSTTIWGDRRVTPDIKVKRVLTPISNDRPRTVKPLSTPKPTKSAPAVRRTSK